MSDFVRLGYCGRCGHDVDGTFCDRCQREVQPKEESMRQRSKHFNSRHPAVAAVACPVCHVAAGVPCVRARDGRRREAHGTETHVGRVNKFERDALPGEPGSVLPPSPVDTDNDCAP